MASAETNEVAHSSRRIPVEQCRSSPPPSPGNLRRARSKSPPPSSSAVPVSPVPPDLWTRHMIRMWQAVIEDAKKTKKRLTTVDDLAMLGESEKPIKLNSPRSIQACLHLGIDPRELVYRPVEAFQDKGLDIEIQMLKYDHYEKLRKDKIQKLQAHRAQIIQKEQEKRAVNIEMSVSHNNIRYKCPKDFQEKEKHRLEVVHRRQQREIDQLARFEAQREQMLKENKARAEAERKIEEQKRLEKAERDKKWQAELRERELQKLKEEEAFEKRIRRMNAKRYLLEQQQLAREKNQMRKQRKEALKREQEKLAKQEEFRRQTEKFLEAQQEALIKKQMEMQQKDDERRRLLDEQNKKRVQKHMKACRLAEARHANATAKFYELMRKREEDYQRRQEDLRIKLRKQEDDHKLLEAEKKRREEQKEQQRLEVLREAQAQRNKRVQEFAKRAESIDVKLQKFIMRRQLEHTHRVVKRQLEFEDKQARAESVQRIRALQRYEVLQRIEAETERVRAILESKARQEEEHHKAIANLHMKEKG